MLWRAASGLELRELVSGWFVWWLGDTAGFLIVAPPLLTAAFRRGGRNLWRPLIGLLVTATLSVLAFTDTIFAPVRILLVFPPFMLLIWVGMTERLRTGSLHV